MLFLNVHTHALVLDGVFAEDPNGMLRFHPAPAPEEEALADLLSTIAHRIERLLIRRGVWAEDAAAAACDPWIEETPVLAGLAAASVQGRVALGPRAGGEVRRCESVLDEAPLPIVRGPCHAALAGFDLDAGVVVSAGDRDRLERVCRYALRPPIAQDQIRLTADGEVLLALRHPWSDGTTHLRFHPLELLERLASLTPRPRINLVLYYGVLAAHAAWRARLCGLEATGGRTPLPTADPADGALVMPTAEGATGAHVAPPPSVEPARRPGSNWLWAQLMQRSFGFDVLQCPRCGGRFRLLALIEDGAVARRILGHLGLPTEVPPARAPRAPPVPYDTHAVDAAIGFS